MSGTPEKILEYLLDTVSLETNYCNPTDSFLGDFLRMHSIFMPTAQLHRALLTHYRGRDPGPEEVVVQEGMAGRADPSVAMKEKVLHLVTQWVSLLGARAQEDPAVLALLQELRSLVLNDAELGEHAENDGVSYNTKHETTRNTSVREKLRNWVWILDRVPGRCDRTGSSPREREPVRRSERGSSASVGHGHRLSVCPWEGTHDPCPPPAPQGPHLGLDTLLEGYSSKELANHLNAYDWEIFQRIHELDVVEHVVGRGEGVSGGGRTHLDSYLTRFNLLQYWVVTGICLCAHLGRRSALLRKFIKMAARCKELRNMNSFFALMFGLSNAAVRRLSLTWERLPSKHRGIFQDLERLLDPSRNHWVYRQTVRKFNSAYLPFLPLLLKDLTFIHEGNKTYLNGLVNFEKMRMLSRVVSVVPRCQCNQDVSEPSLGERREQTLRVSLRELRGIDNQGTLNQLSLELEPPRDRGPANPPTAK
ncbi:rap guanine nucleotide exchange factor 4-like [Hemiscyllium ocellatum]|uniref:rap guanine nucleotide exchange factor 4-like n=1 Tax=Hemiscyllium ocellatum TaxID=170820 RepID=UPI0029665D17|nr:rap guanine nucleotide exchange factor 4-like [Hemiscyllium ocellatum]